MRILLHAMKWHFVADYQRNNQASDTFEAQAA